MTRGNAIIKGVPRTPALYLRRAAIAIAVLSILALGLWLYAQRWRPSLAEYPVQGIDVSHHQGLIDWPAVRAAGADFAYIKATEGGDHRDTRFPDNWAAAHEAGVKRGAYHFFTLCRSGEEQAANFITTVPRQADALPPAVDLEFGGNCAARPSRQRLIAELAAFIQAVQSHSGKPVVLYITSDFEAAYRISEAVSGPLWLRHIFRRPNFGARPWVMWQASNIRRIDGIKGPVDWNVVNP